MILFMMLMAPEGFPNSVEAHELNALKPALVWEAITKGQVTGDGRFEKGRLFLARGESAYIRARAGEYFRVRSRQLNAFYISQSDGGGLFYPLKMLGATQGHEQVSVTPFVADKLIWIRNDSEQSATVALALGYYQKTSRTYLWQAKQLNNLSRSQYRRYPQMALEHFYDLPKESEEVIELNGPRMVILAVQRVQNFLNTPLKSQLSLQLGDAETKISPFYFRSNPSHRYRRDGEDYLLSKTVTRYIWVPDGRHDLRIRADSNLLINLFQSNIRSHQSEGFDEPDIRQPLEEQERIDRLVDLFSLGNFSHYLEATQDYNFDAEYARDLFNSMTMPRTLWPIGRLENHRVILTEVNLNWDRKITKKYFSEPEVNNEKRLFTFNGSHYLPLEASISTRKLSIAMALSGKSASFEIDVGGKKYPFYYKPKEIKYNYLTQLEKTAEQTSVVAVSRADILIPPGIDAIKVNMLVGEAELHISVRDMRPREVSEQQFLATLQSQPCCEPDSVNRLLNTDLFQVDDLLPLWLRHREKQFTKNISPQLNAEHVTNFENKIKAIFSSVDDPQTTQISNDNINFIKGGLVFYPQLNKETKALIIASLASSYEQSNSVFALQSLYAYLFLNRNRLDVLPKLIELLYQSKHYAQAIQLGLIGVSRGYHFKDQTLLIKSAIKANWQQALTRILVELPDDESRYWLVQNELYQNSLVDQGLARNKSCQIDEARDTWHALEPIGDKVVEQINVYNPDLRKYYQRWKIKPLEKVQFKVKGPVRLKLNVNPLHHQRELNAKDSSLNDWVYIKHEQRDYYWPIINNKIRNTHQTVSIDPAFAGESETVYFDVGSGWHTFAVWTEANPSLLTIEALGPALYADKFLESITEPDSLRRKLYANPVSKKPVSNRFFVLGKKRGLPLKQTPARYLPLLYSAADVKSGACPVSKSDNDNYFVSTNIDLTGVVSSENTTIKLRALLKTLNTKEALVVNQVSDLSRKVIRQLLTEIYAQIYHKQKGLPETERYQLVGVASLLATQYPEDSIIQSLVQTIRWNYSWQSEELVVGGDGIKVIHSDGAPPESSFIRRKEPLLGSTPLIEEIKLNPLRDQTIVVNAKQAKTIEVSLRLDKAGFVKLPPVHVQILINDRVAELVELNESTPRVTQKLQLRSGNFRIRLKIENASNQHWVYAQFSELTKQTSSQKRSHERHSIVPERKRQYYVLSDKRELRLYLPYKTWLRISSYDGQSWFSEYRYIPQAGNIAFKLGDTKGRFVRFASLREDVGKVHLPEINVTPPMPLSTDIASEDNIPILAIAADTPKLGLIDRTCLIRQGAGTHGFYLNHQKRFDLDFNDDSDSTELHDNDEKYWELGWRYRKKIQDGRFYWRSDLLLRKHVGRGLSVGGIKQKIIWRPYRRNWRIDLSATGYKQFEDGASNLTLSTQFIGFMPLSKKINWLHRIKIFTADLEDADDNEETTLASDNDVYTNYRENHLHGLSWRETLSYRPWYQTRVSVSGTLLTNADFSLSVLDQVQAEVRLDHAWRGWQAKVSASHRWLWADDHRFLSAERTYLSAALNWRRWQGRGSRWLLGLSSSYDLQNKRSFFAMTLTWNKPGAQRLEDFSPDESVFRALEQERATDAVWKNEIIPLGE